MIKRLEPLIQKWSETDTIELEVMISSSFSCKCIVSVFVCLFVCLCVCLFLFFAPYFNNTTIGSNVPRRKQNEYV